MPIVLNYKCCTYSIECEKKDSLAKVCRENIAAFIELKQHIKKYHIQLIHSNASNVDLGAFASAFFHIPHVWHVREILYDDYKLKYYYPHIMKFLFKHADKVIFISKYIKKKRGYSFPNAEILYNGINLNSKKEFCNEIRALIEKPSFFSDLSGYENLKLLANIQKKISDKEILEALEIVNLTSEKDKKYSKYSLGMKQKLGIAQAIMEKTKFIVLDEPFNGIERETVTRIKDYLKSLKDKGVTIIISSHIKEDLNELVDEMIYFEDGEILSEAN